MNKWEKELAALELKGERSVLNAMKGHYQTALERVYGKIDALSERDDLPGIRQRRYQEALAEQIGGIIDDLEGGAYSTLEGYLQDSYEDGFLGTLYSLQKQGIPLAFPIDRASMARSTTATADGVKLSKRVYSNTSKLQKQVIAEITRGFAQSSHVTEVAGHIAADTDIAGEIKRNVKGRTDQAMRRSMTIARTEKGRVLSESRLDAMRKAKAAGADIVKQWDSTLDGRTRKSHRKLDGQIREIEEPFEINGHKAMAPHKFGRPEEDINCRCACLQRARAALDIPEGLESTKWDGVKQCHVDISDAKSYGEFKRRYRGMLAAAELPSATRVTMDDGAEPLEKEKRAAEWLADQGFDVHFLKPSTVDGVKTPDFTLNGDEWELKRPEGSGKNTLERQIKRAMKQSDRVVIDISGCGFTVEEADSQLSTLATKFNGLRGLMAVGPEGFFKVYK